MNSLPGPLTGVRVVDFSRLAPGPYATMILADLGADVVVVRRPAELPSEEDLTRDPYGRGKRFVCLDLRTEDGTRDAKRLAMDADVLVEGFRPGVLTRHGLGWDDLSDANGRLVYCSITGYGQSGPWANVPGHDVNYLATAGALANVGRTRPEIPLNLLADCAGGGLMAVIGILAALRARESHGAGQYVDVSMQEGVLSLLTMHLAFAAQRGDSPRGRHFLDGSWPRYSVYQAADGEWVSVGIGEPEFFDRALVLLGLDPQSPPPREHLAEALSAAFSKKPAWEWEELATAAGTCITWVRSLTQVAEHPQVQARRSLIETSAGVVPEAFPRLSLTPGNALKPAAISAPDAIWAPSRGPTTGSQATTNSKPIED